VASRTSRGPRAALAALLAGVALVGLPGPAQAAGPAAPLPRVAVVAQGVSSANRAHLFKSQEWDFKKIRHAFNSVSIMPGDQGTVETARRAGLAVVLEFDYKADFFSGRDITPKVERIVNQIQSNPGTVAAVHVADRLNERYSPAQGLRYLAATGGVFHREVPGVPVLVNVADWQLTCGLPEQASCGSHGPEYQYEVHSTLDQFYHSGYVDGFTLADNLKQASVGVQQEAWETARSRWPAPFLLWSTCSQLSFPWDAYAQAFPSAVTLTEAYMRAPIRQGADGVALWAWHQQYGEDLYTFLDKDGSDNDLWDQMTVAAKDLWQSAESPSPQAQLVPAPAGEGQPRLLAWARALVGVAAAALLALLAGPGRRRILRRLRVRRR
jgi:hypothetical protein